MVNHAIAKKQFHVEGIWIGSSIAIHVYPPTTHEYKEEHYISDAATHRTTSWAGMCLTSLRSQEEAVLSFAYGAVSEASERAM